MTVAGQSQSPNHTQTAEIQRELDTHVNTLRDLGPAYSNSVAESLLDRVDQLAKARARSEFSTRGATINKYREQRKTLAMIFAFSIPLLAIAGGTGGLIGVAIVGGVLGLIALVAMTHNF